MAVSRLAAMVCAVAVGSGLLIRRGNASPEVIFMSGLASAGVCAVLMAIGNWLWKSSRPHITELWIYPVKSCGGVRVTEAQLDWLGMELDRRFMLVSSEGRFVTQREFPKMRLINTRIAGRQVTLFSELAAEELTLPSNIDPKSKTMRVELWETHMEVFDCGDEPSEWFSNILGSAVRVVAVPPQGIYARPFKPERVKSMGLLGDKTDGIQRGFADGYPMLVISEESLAELNRRITAGGEEPVGRINFRPNIVVGGCGRAFDEDTWGTITVGEGTRMVFVKPCDRCVLTTVQASGTFHKRVEPLRTLRKFRRVDDAVFFGQNAVHVRAGDMVREGDEITVTATKPREPNL